MRDQRRGGRFAVGAGDGDERRIRGVTAPFAAKQFDVADHFDAGLLRGQHGPVRTGVGERRAPASAPGLRNSSTGPFANPR